MLTSHRGSFSGHNAITREDIIAAGERGILAIIRQSSEQQIRENVGSGMFQLDFVRGQLQYYGFTLDQAKVLGAGTAESAMGEKPRPAFEELLQRLRADEAGLVVYPEHHRSNRNGLHSRQLADVCAEHNVLILTSGGVFDARLDEHYFMLQMFGVFWEYQQRCYAAGQTAAKFAKAQRLGLITPMPAGILWGAPANPDFRRELERAGLTGCLDAIRDGRHKTTARMDNMDYYVLPFPDADVARSVELRLAWLRETQSLAEVYRRIVDGADGWPRKGLVPTNSFMRWEKGSDPGWARVQRTSLASWFRNPALFGIYACYASSLVHSREAKKGRRSSRRYAFARARTLPPIQDYAELLESSDQIK